MSYVLCALIGYPEWLDQSHKLLSGDAWGPMNVRLFLLKTRPSVNQQQQKMRICHLVDVAFQEDHIMKIKESEMINKNLYLTRKLKKAIEHKGDGDTNCSWCTRNCPQGLEERTGGKENQWKNYDYRLQHCWDRLNNWEESWRPEETCCHSDSSQRPPTNAGVKNSLIIIMIIIVTGTFFFTTLVSWWFIECLVLEDADQQKLKF